MQIRFLNYYVLVFICFSPIEASALENNINKSEIYTVSQEVRDTLPTTHSPSKVPTDLSTSTQQSTSHNTDELLALHDLINSQQSKIESLEAKLNRVNADDGMNFAVWTGILLASVAIILTALGIVMALFSFFGYKKIKNSVPVLATTTSTLVATSVAEKLAPEVTEKVLIKLLEDGDFDEVINDAVAKVTFRGVGYSSSGLLEEVEK